MKMDEDVKMISAEAPLLFAKAAQMFITGKQNCVTADQVIVLCEGVLLFILIGDKDLPNFLFIYKIEVV